MKIYVAQNACSIIFCVSENTYMLASSRNLCLRYISYTQSISRNFQKLQASLSLKERKYSFPCLCVEFFRNSFCQVNKQNFLRFIKKRRKTLNTGAVIYLVQKKNLRKIMFLKIAQYLFKKSQVIRIIRTQKIRI